MVLRMEEGVDGLQLGAAEETWTLILDDAMANSFIAPAEKCESIEEDMQLTSEGECGMGRGGGGAKGRVWVLQAKSTRGRGIKRRTWGCTTCAQREAKMGSMKIERL